MKIKFSTENAELGFRQMRDFLLRFLFTNLILILILFSQISSVKADPKICTEIDDSSLGAAGRSSLYWKKTKLRVSFLDGTELQKQKVREFAPEWSNYANIEFEFVEKGFSSDIRITFSSGGSWSYVGTSAEKHKTKATMQFGWFDKDTADNEFKRVILHEFGHALGLIHEHQSPAATIKWNEPVVIEYYKENFKWTENAVRKHIFGKYSKDQVSSSTYDPLSIMHYHIDSDWTMDGFTVSWNTKLSEMDISFIRKAYP